MAYKTALITGASSGIGREFALALAKQNVWNLMLVARDATKLEKVKAEIQELWNAGESPAPVVELILVDLTQENERNILLQRVRLCAIDLLINNAGQAYLHLFEDSDPAMNERLIQLHCIAPMHLCRELVPMMISRGSGCIINVCSTVALAPAPYFACYAASKTFLLHFSIALAQEVQAKKVRVLALCPGSTDTPGHSKRTTVQRRSLLGTMTSQRMVCLALRAAQSNAPLYVVGNINRLIFGLLHILPLALSANVMGRIGISCLQALSVRNKENKL